MNSVQQRAVGIALVALIPAILFLLSRQTYIVFFSFLCTLLIAGSLYVMFTSTGEDPGWAKPL
ncbi:MAG: hypothetical protein ABEJ22_08415 [Haloferacaceae archaeon]